MSSVTEAYEQAPRIVNIGDGRRLAVQCKGAGPLVLLETGGGGSGIGPGWNGVDERIAKFASVITYDRAGLGLSIDADKGLLGDLPAISPSAAAPSVADRAHDLAALLDRIAPEAPVILVGWSLGALIVQHYAALNPRRVAGLLLVDPTPLDSFASIPGWLHWLVDLQLPTRLFRRLARSGLLSRPWMQVRLKRVLASQFGPRFDRGATLDRIGAAMADPRLHEALLLETLKLRASLPQTATILQRHGLPQVPMILLQAQYRGGGSVVARYTTLIERAHAGTAATVAGSEVRKLDDISHHVPFEAPEAIEQAVRDLIARSGERERSAA